MRLQWDPDHSPTGHDEARRAMQLGMSGDTLRCYAREWIIASTAIIELVAAQRHHIPGAHTIVTGHRLRRRPCSDERDQREQLPNAVTIGMPSELVEQADGA